MPQILVTAGVAEGQEEDTVMLNERVNATDFESERFAANLLERLGWAVEDATAAERREIDPERDAPERAKSVHPERDTEPAGVA